MLCGWCMPLQCLHAECNLPLQTNVQLLRSRKRSNPIMQRKTAPPHKHLHDSCVQATSAGSCQNPDSELLHLQQQYCTTLVYIRHKAAARALLMAYKHNAGREMPDGLR
jgi:hypothetical protein